MGKIISMVFFNTVCYNFLRKFLPLCSRAIGLEHRSMSFPGQRTASQFDLQPPTNCHVNHLK